MTEQTDADGTWRVEPNGVRTLVEPSGAWLAWRASLPVEQPPADPVAVAAETIRDEIASRLAPSSVNTIVEVKAAVIDGLDAAVSRLTAT